MGLLDNVRGRLGLGSQDDYRDDEDYEEDYDDYVDGSDTAGDFSASGAQQPAPMRGFGVDRADYYNDNHTPLVSLSDVRSHQPPPRAAVRAAGQTAASAGYAGSPSAGSTGYAGAAGSASGRSAVAAAAVPPFERQPIELQSLQHDRIPAPRAYRRVTNSYEHEGLDDDALAFKDGLARGDVNSLSHLQGERLRLEDTGRFPQVNDGRVRSRGRRRIEYLSPVSYAEAEQITRRLRGGSVVVLDLTKTRPELAKRILDFSFGVASALEGQVDRYADRVYVFTAKTSLTSEERASIRLEM